MRSIKFRCWNNTVSQYEEIESLDFGKGTVHQVNTDHDRILFPDKECELEEFTGLKDKNGVEIYEGDLLNWIEWREELTEVPDVYVVSWLEKEARFTLNCYRDGRLLDPKDDLLDVGEAFAVIGNIHENGDLLK